MKNKWTSRLIVLALLIMGGLFTMNYVLYGGARDIQAEESAFKLNSTTILKDYENDGEEANKKYLNKTVEISGKVTQVNKKAIIVDNTIICNMKPDSEKLIIETSTKVKGRVVGFDDLLGELKLDDCSIIKN
jgi:hypothetical protein